MQRLEEKLGYHFKDRELLKTALTHSSYANERGNCSHYERLEFLGDSILGFTTARFLFSQQPQLPEGRMTKLRAELVCEKNLNEVAVRLDIGRFMRLGKGQERTGGRKTASILADMVEAIIAAIYLDSDQEHAERFIMEHILNDVELAVAERSHDYKTELQEIIQRVAGNQLEYRQVEEFGPDHEKTFVFQVLLNGAELGVGSGRSKKAAEQAAAKIALEGMTQ